MINNASFMVIFPLTFVANTFVPAEDLPGPLQTFAEWNPVSAVTQASRELFGNIPPGAPEPTAWPLQNPVLYTLSGSWPSSPCSPRWRWPATGDPGAEVTDVLCSPVMPGAPHLRAR